MGPGDTAVEKVDENNWGKYKLCNHQNETLGFHYALYLRYKGSWYSLAGKMNSRKQ